MAASASFLDRCGFAGAAMAANMAGIFRALIPIFTDPLVRRTGAPVEGGFVESAIKERRIRDPAAWAHHTGTDHNISRAGVCFHSIGQ